jgi:fluoroquinolone resistance protein
LSPRISSQSHYSDQVFADVVWERREQLVSSEFHDCTFVRCRLVETVFRSCRFLNCTFCDCDLSLAQVPDSVFSGTKFEGSRIVGVDWTRADWSAIGLRGPIGFDRCAISHSTFIGLKLRRIRIRNSVAVNVDFREADLSLADFAGTDLSESLFSSTDLTKADLSRARNYHIDPGRNVLKQAKFSLPEAMSLLYSMDIVLVDGEA